MNASILALALFSLAAAPVETTPTPSTRLYVRTVPPGAEVRLDGRPAGKSDDLFVVPAGVGKMTIEVQLDGHYPERQEVEIRGGRITRVELKMRAIPGSGESGTFVVPPLGGIPPEGGTTNTSSEKDRQMTAAAVEKAVKTIATFIKEMKDKPQLSANDPRLIGPIAPLKALDEAAVVAELAKSLDSQETTTRFAAAYILQRGKFASIEPAVPALLRLCEQPDRDTRWMAASVLGGNRIADSFLTLMKMASDDPSDDVRGAAVTALGELGDPAAAGILEKALRDPNLVVRGPAQRALSMLRRAPDGSSKAVAQRPDHPDNISLEFRRGVELSQRDYPEPQRSANLRQAVSVFEHIVKTYRHMDYYEKDPVDRAESRQLMVPWAAIYAAELQPGIDGKRVQAKALLLSALDMLKQTYARRIDDWTKEPPEPQPAADDPCGSPIELSKWKSRQDAWKQRQRDALAGNVFGPLEMVAVKEVVRQFGYADGPRKPSEVPAVMAEIIKLFPGTPMAKVAKQYAERSATLTETAEALPEVLEDKSVAESPAASRDVAAAVEKAVKTISTCAEGDPRVAAALATLKGLPEAAVVADLAKALDSNEATTRRAAVYALGLLGDPAARGVLEKALKDPDELVRGNALAALEMLRRAAADKEKAAANAKTLELHAAITSAAVARLDFRVGTGVGPSALSAAELAEYMKIEPEQSRKSALPYAWFHYPMACGAGLGLTEREYKGRRYALLSHTPDWTVLDVQAWGLKQATARTGVIVVDFNDAGQRKMEALRKASIHGSRSLPLAVLINDAVVEHTFLDAGMTRAIGIGTFAEEDLKLIAGQWRRAIAAGRKAAAAPELPAKPAAAGAVQPPANAPLSAEEKESADRAAAIAWLAVLGDGSSEAFDALIKNNDPQKALAIYDALVPKLEAHLARRAWEPDGRQTLDMVLNLAMQIHRALGDGRINDAKGLIWRFRKGAEDICSAHAINVGPDEKAASGVPQKLVVNVAGDGAATIDGTSYGAKALQAKVHDLRKDKLLNIEFLCSPETPWEEIDGWLDLVEGTLNVPEVTVRIAGAAEKPIIDAKSGMMESRVLLDEIPGMLAEGVAADKKAGRPLPPDWDKPTFLPALVEELKKQDRSPLLVTPEEEKQFAAGKFADALNTLIVEKLIKMLRDFKVALSPINAILVEQFEAGKLHGARLELARRVLMIPVKGLIQKIGGPEAGEIKVQTFDGQRSAAAKLAAAGPAVMVAIDCSAVFDLGAREANGDWIGTPGRSPRAIEKTICIPVEHELAGPIEKELAGRYGPFEIVCVSSASRAEIYVQATKPGIPLAEMLRGIDEHVAGVAKALPAGVKVAKTVDVTGQPIPPPLEIRQIESTKFQLEPAKMAALGVTANDVFEAIRKAAAWGKPPADATISHNGAAIPLRDVATMTKIREPDHRVRRWPPQEK